MKKIYALCCAIFCLTITNAQPQDSVDFIGIFEEFETTVLEKNIEEHSDLFIHTLAPVYSIRKTPTGPEVYSLMNVNHWTDYFSQPFDYHIELSDYDFSFESNFVVATVHYQSFVDDELYASGDNLFGFIKKNGEWKLAFMQNTNIPASDSTDYSEAFELDNTVNDVIDDLVYNYNMLENEALVDQFVSQENQILLLEGELNNSYDPDDHNVDGFAEQLGASLEERELSIANMQIDIIDDYIAIVYADYEISLEGETEEEGRTYFTLIGSLEEGWKISSWIRQSNVVMSVKEMEQAAFELYPNPSNDIVNIRAEHDLSALRVLDQGGRVIFEEKQVNQRFYQLESDQFGSGLYILELNFRDGRRGLQRFVVN